MKRPGPPDGPPSKGRKPYTGTKPPKGQERDPGAARRKKTGSAGYPRPPEQAAARKAEAEAVWPAPKPVRARKPGLDTVAKPQRPAHGQYLRAQGLAGRPAAAQIML